MCATGLFVEGLGRELGTYHGVLDQAKYFGRAEGPATIKVSAVRTSGGRHPVGGPESRGWRRIPKLLSELVHI
eukprot:9486118-Pyramimonas_sp.AAC.1